MPMDEPTTDCPNCGGISKRCFMSKFYINNDIDLVTDHVTGDPQRFTSRVQLEAELKKRGLYQKTGKGWW